MQYVQAEIQLQILWEANWKVSEILVRTLKCNYGLLQVTREGNGKVFVALPNLDLEAK